MKVKDILKLKVVDSDLGKSVTIKEYLKKLLLTLWEKGERFSGKSPFGNSGWEYDLYLPLIKANIVKGELDEDDCINEVDVQGADLIIKKAIKSL